MSYAAQYGSQLELRFSGSGYTPPTGNAVALRFVTDTPIVRIKGSTKIYAAFAANVTRYTEFSIYSGATTGFEQPYRSFDIQSGTIVVGTHSMRALDLSTGTTPTFRHGSRYELSQSSALDFFLIISKPTSFSATSNTTVAYTQIAYKLASTAVKSKTTMTAKGGYNAMMEMRVNGGAAFTPAGARRDSINFSIASGTTVLGRVQHTATTQVSVSTSSALSLTPIAFNLAASVVSGGSTMSVKGIQSVRGSHAVVGGTSCAFASAYSVSEVPLIEINIHYVRTIQSNLHVRI